jgi:hypothetical protein
MCGNLAQEVEKFWGPEFNTQYGQNKKTVKEKTEGLKWKLKEF